MDSYSALEDGDRAEDPGAYAQPLDAPPYERDELKGDGAGASQALITRSDVNEDTILTPRKAALAQTEVWRRVIFVVIPVFIGTGNPLD